MKIICEKNNLLNGVQIVSRAVPSKTNMSILECILIDASEETINLTANDMELGIKTSIEGEIKEKGLIALNAKLFHEIVRKLPDNYITIESDESLKTLITCEKSRYVIIGKSGEEFAYLPVIDKYNPVLISQFSFKEVVRQTIFSISEGDSNKMMSGELFEIKGDNLRVASLDGHRISIRNIKLKDSYEESKVIIPGKTLSEVSKIISGEAEKDIYIYINEKNIMFEFDNTIVLSRIIGGDYFNIDNMYTDDYETKVSINRKNLIECIERATLLVKESDKKPIILNVKDNNLELKINSSMGSLKEDIDIEKKGSDIVIGFNAKFLIEALRAIDEEIVCMYMVNQKTPCFIKDDNISYLYLVLPVNFANVS